MFTAKKSVPMKTYKLTYFTGRGRGEVARQLFYLAGVPFEDIRIEMSEWPAFKDKTPFEQVPILEVDEKVIPQSYAINRYLAREFGYAGEYSCEAAWVDAVADLYKDYTTVFNPVLMVLAGFAQGDKDQLVKDVAIPARDKYYRMLEKVLKNNEDCGHFVGSSLTWVDLLIADHVSVTLNYLPDFLDGFPTILDTVKRIQATPKLKEWLEKRPNTKF